MTASELGTIAIALRLAQGLPDAERYPGMDAEFKRLHSELLHAEYVVIRPGLNPERRFS